MTFKLKAKFRPTGDQPQAIEKLAAGLRNGYKHQTLLGVTGSGKTFTIANVIEKIQRPVLVISHNKTLAWQLYQEFKEFFPENSVHYFVSYYDYYQPEAYIPQTDTYIEKDAKINEEIDKLRHAATQSVLTRPDTIIVASVSCIYGIGDPKEYQKIALDLKTGQKIKIKNVLKHLANLQYQRNDYDAKAGNYSVKGDIIDIYLPSGEEIIRLEFLGNRIDNISRIDTTRWPRLNLVNGRGSTSAIGSIKLFPAKHFVAPQGKLEIALINIKNELRQRLRELKYQNKLLEAQRLKQKTKYDMEILKETGYCAGIENYSRHLSFRKTGEPTYTLIDYFSAPTTSSAKVASTAKAKKASTNKVNDFLTIIDESHMTIPQIKAMYSGDRARKETLIEYGFRLPSALDNRPLKFNEFEKKINQVIYMSATPGPYEYQILKTCGERSRTIKNKNYKLKFKIKKLVVEQLIRPTGLLDPTIEVKPTKNQIPSLIKEIKKRTAKKQRVLVTTLTKRLAEDLTEYLAKENIKVQYLHSEIKTLYRPEILRDLRLGKYDVLVGINLLREGLDLPEVTLVAILDADKEGFLRNETTIIQTMGRAARHPEGHIIMYADKITNSMKAAIKKIQRKRKIQEEYNKKHGIIPKAIKKPIRNTFGFRPKIFEDKFKSILDLEVINIKKLETKMKKASSALNFEKAAQIRDGINKLKELRK